MNNRPTLKPSFAKRAGSAATGILAVAIPLILGVTNAPLLRSQAAARTKAESKQNVDPDLRFEAASVRRVEIPNNGRGVPVFPVTTGIGTKDPTHYVAHGVWLMNLIGEAFGVRSENISGAAYLKVQPERYDVAANIPEGATKEQFNAMLGNLLRDRFHLRFHIESKTVPAYALRIGKNGPKFKEAVPHDDEKPPAERIDAQGFPVPLPGFHGMTSLPHDGELFTVGRDVPLADLARTLEHPSGTMRPEDRPVIDETGLTGHYDFKWHHEYLRGPAANAGAASDPVPSALDAVEQQLGLKLESTTTTIPQLIVDSIDRDPVEN